MYEGISAQTHQKAGSALIALGLVDAFMSFGLLLTRKNDGETHYNWLGSDDYFVLSFLFVGGALMALSGKQLYLAGDNLTTASLAPSFFDHRRSGSIPNTAHLSLTNIKSPLTDKIEAHQQTAYKYAFAASVTFLIMSLYAFLGGFGETPTPESHIGPNTNKTNQMTGFCLLYGLTAMLSTTLFIEAFRANETETTHKHSSTTQIR